MPFLFVSTWPLAVTTVVGLFEILTVSNSAELRFFLLIICLLAPKSITNSFSSGFIVDAAGETLIGRRKECSFVRFFELTDILGKFPRVSAGASLLSFGPQISRRRNFADENF